ncbi:hypothetical protein DBR06_SOUSAS20210015, partial [Sousa chinensis]
VSKEGTAPRVSRVQGPPSVQGATTRDAFDSTAIRDKPLSCHHVFKFVRIKLCKSPLLADVDLLAARELELGPALGLNHMFLVLQLGADGHHDVANVDPDPCALGLSKGTTHTCLEPRLGTACQSLMSTGKGCLRGPLGQPIQATGCIHYRGGCCLQPLRTRPPWGKEHSWLQMIDT